MATMTSCNQDRDMNETVSITSEVTSMAKSAEESSSMTPFDIKKVNDNYEVSFAESAMIYSIVDNSQNSQYIQKLKEALKMGVPLLITREEGLITNVQTTREKRNTTNYTPEYGYNNLTEAVESMKKLNALALELSNKNTYIYYESSHGIPNFNFRVDGCYARAHRMREILKSKGYKCEKVWIQGDLRAVTNKVTIRWGYHVAIAVKVTERIRQIQNGKYVMLNATVKKIIDPAFQNMPMDEKTWKDKCTNTMPTFYHVNGKSVLTWNNPKFLQLIYTNSNVYTINWRNNTRNYDNQYSNTRQVLNQYKNSIEYFTPNVTGLSFNIYP
ncbi:hypothetical protein D1631_06360 [Chryseobacterium nematophagum]|uniref:Protein glutaminase domain-containing protein n=2 Tax=Chryseobacterium nematophagum TaxID=2305228 RepID=A0A3M7TDJ3_9FLAO|nr:hypothetical protein D1631_06360 [Chryseobacterium nematophagum]